MAINIFIIVIDRMMINGRGRETEILISRTCRSARHSRKNCIFWLV